MANPVGAEDPLAVNAWHLKNTGPSQVVSAAVNNGVAGIDARVETVHRGGVGCTGKGITIAIVDSALEIGHEDLRDNVLGGLSWNFATNTTDTTPVRNSKDIDHGTGVAGVAAARGWNGKGSRGTAPFASLVAYPTVDVKRLPTTTDAEMTYLSFGARVLAGLGNVVNLFGTRADGVSIFNFSAGAEYAAPQPVVDDNPQELAARHGTGNLRGGLGAIYFQASGNEHESSEKFQLPDGSTMKVNCQELLKADAGLLGGTVANIGALSCGSSNHEPAGKPYFYQVGSIHNTGKASTYSSGGAANWITGFGGEHGVQEAAIITTDDTGCDSGYNNTANRPGLLEQIGAAISRLIADLFGASPSDQTCNYTGRQNGTSAATPSVSGVAALLLEANPSLTWRDVGFILARSARKVDDAIAGTAEVRPTFQPTGAAAWDLELPWVTNAAGFNFQNRYGFGLVDADAALKLTAGYVPPAGRRAADLTSSTASDSVPTQQNGAGVNTAIASFADASAISGPMRVDLTVTNQAGASINPGLLQFEIRNLKTGTRSILMPAFTAWYGGGKTNQLPNLGVQKFRFHTNAFYGEALDGGYEVRVIDFSSSSGAPGKALAFKPQLTSYSM